MDTKLKIWGVEIEEYIDPVEGKRLWVATIDKRFYYKGRWVVGLNEKLLNEARERGVDLRVRVGQGVEIPVNVPTEKMLKEMVKAEKYEDRPSNFENGQPMRIYYLTL